MSPTLRYYIDYQIWLKMRSVYETFGKDVPEPDRLDYKCEKHQLTFCHLGCDPDD